MTASVSGLAVANLRARAAQLMRQTGGKDAFGPEAIQRQRVRLERLGLLRPAAKWGRRCRGGACSDLSTRLLLAAAKESSPSTTGWRVVG